MKEIFVSKAFDTALPIIEAIAIALIGYIIYKASNKWLEKLLSKTKRLDPMVHTFILHVLHIFIFVVVVIAALGKLGINASSIITVIAACGAAIALALQDSLSNLASGILIMVSTPFHKGDYIVMGDVAGTVEKTDLLYTIIMTDELRSVTIPNSLLTSNTITNYTVTGNRRFEASVDVSYNADLAQARKVLLDLANPDPRVLKNPAVACDVVNYADSGITLFLRGWAKPGDALAVTHFINNNIKSEMDKAGIEIPFPQIDVHLDK